MYFSALIKNASFEVTFLKNISSFCFDFDADCDADPDTDTDADE